MRVAMILVAILAAAALLLVTPARAQGVPPITIDHTPPTEAVPGFQIYLTATLMNATAATITWRNDTMTQDGGAPMTNLSQASGSGWLYAAYLPAQSTPTQITYAINASNGGGYHIESYFLSVSTPTAAGLGPADQESWILTIAASLTMAVCTLAVLYWYTGRRLRREGA